MLLTAIGYFAITRFALLFSSFSQANPSDLEVLKLHFIGLVYDLSFFVYAAIPFLLYIGLIPNRFWNSRTNRLLTHLVTFIVLYSMSFVAVAEWLFWDEFSVRFNFISVDYLVYRREVTNNILESYPIFIILPSIFLVTVLVYFSLIKKRVDAALACKETLSKRLPITAGLLILPVIMYFTIGQELRAFSTNSFVNELASNGPYQFFASFRNNELDYNSFYKTLPDQQASALLKTDVLGIVNSTEVSKRLYGINREIHSKGAEKPLNVVLIMVESLSAKFLGSFGNNQHLTPYLDKLAKESLFFENFYATGTRTTRGLEAVTLSIPPTPGRSIVKRIGHEKNLWSLGHVFNTKGYKTTFLYGGHGYFDNMNEFFSSNGYGIIDEADIPGDETIFSNAWGVSDEDLFNTTIKAANQAEKQGIPFFFHLMTTSNHRPYSYPNGRIDIPSGTGRDGAVKYTDWAIGDFIEKARKTSWFKNTVFVIVADHCAGSAGKTALPLNKYHIPLFIYSPAHIPAKKIQQISSQIDIAPTILSLLQMDYDSYAFGKDILSMNANEGRALIGNYQHLGLYKKGELAILSPKKKLSKQINPESKNPTVMPVEVPDSLSKEAIAYYQGASYIYHHRMNGLENQ